MLRIYLLGLLFGIALTMGEVISWFRIQEMFYFEAFHMFGVIGSSIVFGMLFHLAARRFGWGAESGAPLDIHQYKAGWKRYILGGTVFGLGWAITGACPGPLFITLGAGYLPVIVAILGALMGTFLYGIIMKHLPH